MKLFYREYGQGKQMIILHGLMGSSDNWLPQAKMLGEHYHVWVVDQRNHGQSPHSNEFNYTVLSEDILNFIQEHNIDNPVIIGHSMGGKAAMNFALAHPDKLDKLIVVDIAPKAYDVRHDHIVEGLKAVPIDSVQSRQEANDALAPHISSEAVRQFLLKNLMRKSEGGFGWRINLPVIDQSLEMISGGLVTEGVFEKKTMFIRGSKSDYILDEDREAIKKIFPNATLVTMETGHWVQAEKPEEFVQVVLSFLNAG
ncbi:MAG: alpha/beta fold hydrolase [Cyclobacteriaceae bacterium]|nr:MAG: alpha/beta fold hydrolase [Cyclobacteriaceae bacterium]